MSFRVKDYYSKLEWRIGRGGFGSVYLGYKDNPDEISPSGTRTPSSIASSQCGCSSHQGREQVAIKLEKVGAEQAFLSEEARVLRAVQGGPGIPLFLLFSHTLVATPTSQSKTFTPPSSPSPQLLTRPWQPRQFPPPSPLSPHSSPGNGFTQRHSGPKPYFCPIALPGATPSNPYPHGQPSPNAGFQPQFGFRSPGGSWAPQNGPKPYLSPVALPGATPSNPFPHGESSPSPTLPPPPNSASSNLSLESLGKLEAYNALVLERLGDNLETVFRKIRAQGNHKNPRFELRDIEESPVEVNSGFTPSSIPSRTSRPVGVDPRLCRSVPTSPIHHKKELKQIRDLREEEVAKRPARSPGFSHKTICWIGCHVLRSLEHVHACGFVHRDVKPENLCVGRKQKDDQIFLVDFGMATTFRSLDGMHLPRNEKTRGCIGTQSFMSYRCSGARRDDIESLAYVLLYLFAGTLPWARQVDKFEESFAKSGQKWTAESIQFNANIQRSKQDMLQHGEGLGEYPRELQALVRYVATLEFSDKPDYHFLRTILQDMRKRNKILQQYNPPATPAPRGMNGLSLGVHSNTSDDEPSEQERGWVVARRSSSRSATPVGEQSRQPSPLIRHQHQRPELRSVKTTA